MKRMWINQPSTLQPLHHLHGTNVLAAHEYDHTWQIYFLSGPVVSQQCSGLCLSEGWVGEKGIAVLPRPAGDITIKKD